MGIAVGALAFRMLFCDADCLAVEFDLDSGPVVDGIYPPLELSAAELQNMCVISEFIRDFASDFMTVLFMLSPTPYSSIKAHKRTLSGFENKPRNPG